MKTKTKFHEKISRSVAKSITFRILVILSDIIIVYAVTHRYDLVIAVVLVRNLFSTVLYFFHERIWNSVHWGKAKK